MLVNSRSTARYGFKCHCCQTAPGHDRKRERRAIKRRERQQWRRQWM